VAFEAGQPFRFQVEVEVFPEVELPADIASLDVDVPEPDEIGEDDLEDMIEDMRFQHATLVPKDDAEAVVEDEDVVTVVTSGGQSKELQAQAEGSTGALIGHRAGDEVTLATREDEGITVTVDAINDIELPDLEDLAATVGYDDAEAMRESIRDDLRQRAAQHHEKQVHIAILDALVAASDVDVPSGVVEESVEQEIEQFQQQGHQPTDEQKAELREEIEQRLKRERVLNAFKRREGIELSDEDFESYLEEQAAEYDMPVVKFRALLEREEQLEHFRHERENRLALDRLTERLGLHSQVETPPDADTEEDADDGE
jgi:trigger factor